MTLRLNSEIELQALKARMRGNKGESAPSVPLEAPRKSKYNAVLTEALGIKFHSKKEARYFLELVCRQKAGDVTYFLSQVPIRLPGNTKYVVDFVEFHADGSVRYIDVKGCKTDMYKLKRKQVEALYPIVIKEV